MRWLTLAWLCGSLGCAGLKSSAVEPVPALTKQVGTTEVVVVDSRQEIPDPNRRTTRVKGEQPLPTTKLDDAIRNAVAGIDPPAKRIEVSVESFTLHVVEPGQVGSSYAPLVDPNKPGTLNNSEQNPFSMVMLLIVWPVAELLNLGYHAGKEIATADAPTPGAECRIRATMTVTRSDGRQTSTAIVGKGGDDNVSGQFWGDALRKATERALFQFGDNMKTAMKSEPTP